VGDVKRDGSVGVGQPLEDMDVTNIFRLYKGDTKCLVRWLSGPVKWVGEYAFIPVECFTTGKRVRYRVSLLDPISEMEVLAWVAR
jgi:hypothetical protein